MADRYWVGGTASWDSTAGTKWAETSGGAGGASVPTSADDVFFDANSGAGTVTIAAGNTGAKSINCTGFTGTLAVNAAITLSGSITLVAGMGFTSNGSGVITFNGSATITSAGKQFPQMVINGAGITVQLGDALTSSSAVTHTLTAGTFTTNNFAYTTGVFSSSNTNTRTVNFGSSTVTVGGTSAIDFTASTNLTFNAGTSQINCTSTTPTLQGGNQTFYNVAFTDTSTSAKTIGGANTFNNLTYTGPSSAGVTPAVFNARQTINGTLSTTGTAGNRRVWFRGATYGLAQTFTINGTTDLTDADFRDLYIIGTAAPISGTRIGDLGGCSGITFSTPKTVYWNQAAGGNWSDNAWATSSGGIVNTDNFPLVQDTAIIENTGLNTSAIITLSSAVPYVGNVNMSTRTNAMSIVFGVADFPVYGDWTNGSGTGLGWSVNTWATVFQKRSGTQTITSAGKNWQRVTINSLDGIARLADAMSIPYTFSAGFNLISGTIDLNGQTLTGSGGGSVATVVISASPISEFIFNGGTLICPGSNISFQDVSNGLCTFVAGPGGSGTIRLSSTFAPTFSSTGNNYPCTLDLQVASASITGNNTFENITISAPAAGTVKGLYFSGNQTITATLTCSGGSAVSRVFASSNVIGTTRTLTVGTLSATDCDFRDITIAGTAAGSSPTRAGDCGGNSGITFPAAKTVYWNLAGAQNWSATAWASSSGGVPDINNFPLAQDTAVFDDTGSAGTVTFNAGWKIGTVDASARTTAMTLSTSTQIPFVYGDWKFGTGVTSSSTTGALTFAKRGTQTITSNGVTFGCPVTINAAAGTQTVQLADALLLESTKSLVVSYGTFDAVTYNVTVGLFSAAAGSTLKMGTADWTLTGTGTVWSGGMTNFYVGSSNIVLSDTSTTARTFAGGGLSYNKLTIGGATGISATTITGNNFFSELASTKTVAHTIALGTTTQTFGKWTVTGTPGNVVTLTGTGTNHILAGACTDGIDYLAMGSIGFSANSPGEFYAGANSTGTAAAPVYRIAKPADSTRYWVGGTGNWSDTNRWSTSSGGAGGADVPRSHDDVVFDSSSNATDYTATVDAVTGGVRMKALTIAGPASGNVTLAGSTLMYIHDNVTLPATGLTRTYTGVITLTGSATGKTITTNGVALNGSLIVNGVDAVWSLGSALNIGSSSIQIDNGTFDCATYNLTAAQVSSDNRNTRTIDFDTGTATLLGVTPINFGTTETNRANLTVIAGTSQINCSSANATFSGNNQTFYNVSFPSTGTGANAVVINGSNIFNNLSTSNGPSGTYGGYKLFSIADNQTINGTLSCVAGPNALSRIWFYSSVLGTTRTLTCAAVSLIDADFSDIQIAGAAAPATGTRLGNAEGNSGITFTSKTVYWNIPAGGTWRSAAWALTPGGSVDVNNFPLAQDTVVIGATGLNSGATISMSTGSSGAESYNLVPSIDLSARTTNTVTLTWKNNFYYLFGNLTLASGVTYSAGASSGSLFFYKRNGDQELTSAGNQIFHQNITIANRNGALLLKDAANFYYSSAFGFNHSAGTININGYTLTLAGNNVASFYGTGIDFGSNGTFIFGTPSVPTFYAGQVISGSGTISLTHPSAKTFAGGGNNFGNVALNQGGAGTLTITGNNTFKDITNSYKSTGATTIAMGTTTQRVSQWTAAGEAGRLLTIQGTSATSPCTLVHTGTGTAASVDYLNIIGVRAY